MIYRFAGVSSVVVLVFITYGIVRALLFVSSKLCNSTLLSVARLGSRICCFILNIHIKILGKPVNGSAPLIVSNHIGSLDILVLAASFKTFFCFHVGSQKLAGDWLDVDTGRHHFCGPD